MNIDSKDISTWVSNLGVNPLLANTIGVFSIPLTVLVASTKFAIAGKYDLIVFGVLGVLCLIYSALMTPLLMKMAKKRTGKDSIAKRRGRGENHSCLSSNSPLQR